MVPGMVDAAVNFKAFGINPCQGCQTLQNSLQFERGFVQNNVIEKNFKTIFVSFIQFARGRDGFREKVSDLPGFLTKNLWIY